MSAFKNKTVWITGASSGIGEALARQLAERDARLILSSRRSEVLETLRQSLPNPDRHRVVALDLEQPESLKAVVDNTLADGTTVDVLVNNGGISQRSIAKETELSVDRRLMEINYLGTVAMTKALLPSMLARGRGCICSVASVAGLVGSQMRSGYSGSKFAVVGFMESLRAELYADNIDVVVVCPGFVNTDVSINALTADGSAANERDEGIANGISAKQCANDILDAIYGKRFVTISGKGISRWAPTIKRFAPWIMERRVRKQVYR